MSLSLEINLVFQGAASTEYEYPEYPIYERSDQIDYDGGFLEDYPTSLLQGSHQKGTQRSAQEDYQGYQTLGLGYHQDQTTRRFLRRFGNLASENGNEEDGAAAV